MSALLRSLVFLGLAAAAFPTPAAAPFDGNQTIGFMHRETGKVGVATGAVFAVTSGTTELSGIPSGATVLHAWFYCYGYPRHGMPASVTFQGQPVPMQLIGQQPGVRSDNRLYVYRSDVTSWVAGNGSYTWSLGGPGRGGAILALYRDDTLHANYDIEVHDGAYGGSSSDGGNQTWPPITFTGFTVDGTAPREAEIHFLMEGGSAGATESYLFGAGGAPLTVIAGSANAAASGFEWDRYDVSSRFSGGETSARATVTEGSDAIDWICGVVRTRISPPVYDTTPPEVVIAMPADGAVLAESPGDVLVTVRDESAVTLESTPPLVWSPSSFPAPTAGQSMALWPLSEGANTLSVRARDAYSHESTAVTTVILDTIPPAVAITSPADGAYVRTPLLDLQAAVVDATATTVSSSPAGIDAHLPAGGGSVQGYVALVEGENLVSVAAQDAAQRTSGTSITVILDTLDPQIELLSPLQDSVLAESPVQVSIRVSDASPTTVFLGGERRDLPAGGGLATAELALVAGANEIALRAEDAAGNVALATLRVVLDLEAPIVQILAPENGAIFGPGSSSILLVASVDDLTATELSSQPLGLAATLPAGGGLATGTVALVEGENTLSVSARDAAGRVGSAAVQVVLDTTAPEAAIVSPLAGAFLRGTVDFHAEVSDPLPGSGVAEVVFLVDALELARLQAPPFEVALDTRGFADGAHRLEIRARDGRGNEAQSAVDVTFDNTAPTPSWIAPQAEAIVGGFFDLEARAEDATSGLVRLELFVADGAPLVGGTTLCTPPCALAFVTGREDSARWADGPLVLQVVATDAAGNQSALERRIVVDNSAPERSLIAPLDGAVVSGVIALLAAASDPHLVELELWVDGVRVAASPTSPLAASFDTTLRLDGAMVVTAIARDAAGNTSTSSAHVTVDNLSFALAPSTLNLKSKGGELSVTVGVEGPSAALLMPLELHVLELRVPGGNPVRATRGTFGDFDRDSVLDLELKFDRQALIAAIRAGIASGAIPADGPVPVSLFADGVFELGATMLRVVGR